MVNKNGLGPRNQGPKTGRGLGPCNNLEEENKKLKAEIRRLKTNK